MISADRDAMRELLELAAVPAQKTLNSLMGGAAVTLKEIKEVSLEALAERLPHFSMVVEGRAFSEKEEVRMLYFMDREQAACRRPVQALWMRSLSVRSVKCFPSAWRPR